MRIATQLRKETERLAETIQDLGSEQEVRAVVADINRRIIEWRQRKALEKTWMNRPDLLAGAVLSPQQQKCLAEFEEEEEEKES